ncbi:MAG: DNA repair protein RecN [Lachnospiraceae bacterium]|jgi:DNA repair protein RecN (Recombination protein N)|nr:DNA repair protein RecN [Lachnospiraceae bacterium]
MLLNLHVKNLALIDEADVNLGDGLNILTGETGAGKSILIDAVNMALGAKTARGLLRENGEPASVELLFQVSGEGKDEALEALGITPEEDGSVLVARRMSHGKSICRINDETVTVSKLRAATALLIDIHGQHEHQSLLHKAKHLEILDAYARLKEQGLKGQLSESYRAYGKAQKELSSYEMGEEERIREMDFLSYEIGELSGAGLKDGEIEELELRHRQMVNGGRIMESLARAMEYAGGEAGAGDFLSRAVRELSGAAHYDDGLSELLFQAEEAEGLVNDLGRALSDYASELEFDDRELAALESRLDFLHGLQVKYGKTYEEMAQALESRREKLERLQAFDRRKEEAQEIYERAREEAYRLATELSRVRKEEALKLTASIREALVDLNFLDVQFSVDFSELSHISENGLDEIEFLISTNPGEPLKPLSKVASGGELSRIMLAIKAVLADSDEIETLIFDEIDAGISGRTAQSVSEKLNDIGKSHQVICITHLPQIAAMADCHYKIEKTVKSGRTVTEVTRLKAGEEIEELCRLLGGAAITEAVEKNAREMKELAKNRKQQKRR